MTDLFTSAGIKYAGTVSHPQVNHGAPLPLFVTVPPANRPGINTPEGWNALADKYNREFFVYKNGREPENREELYSWINSLHTEMEIETEIDSYVYSLPKESITLIPV